MKLDYNSLQEKFGEVKKYLTKETIEAAEATFPIWDMYDDPEFKPSIDDVIELVNNEIKKVGEEKKPKFKVGDKVLTDHSSVNVYTVSEIEKGKYKLKETSGWWSEDQLTKAKDAKKTTDTKKEKEKYEAPEITVKDKGQKKEKKKEGKKDDKKEVETVLLEKVIMNSFVNLFNQKSRAKTPLMMRAKTLLKKLHKAIVEKKIRKTSEYAKEIMQVQCCLSFFIHKEDDKGNKVKSLSDTISQEDLEKIKQIGSSEKVSTSVKLVKKVIDLQFAPNKEEAKRLLDVINQAIAADVVNMEVKELVKPLEDYTSGKSKEFKIAERQLRGVRGLGNIEDAEEEPDGSGLMSSTDLLNKQFVVMDLGPEWGAFWGMPSANFKAMIYGMPGNGKSTFALKFAGHLSKNLNRKVLYVSSEEGCNYTLKDKVQRMNAANSNLMLSENLNCDLTPFDVIFIDSVNDMQLTPADLKNLPSDKAYVFIFQTTKSGEFRGDQQFLHDVDMTARVEQMRAYKEKARFGGVGKEMDV